MRKIIVIHNIITPTRTEFFNKLSEKFTSLGDIFKVIFMSRTESNREWDTKKEEIKMKFNYEILNGNQLVSKSKNDGYYFHINLNIKSILDTENPDVIIHAGWSSLSAWLSLFWSKKNNKKFILWNESTKYEVSWRRTLTKSLVKLLVKKSDAYISFGTRAKEYLEVLGAKKEKIIETYNTIDIKYFLNQYILLKNKKEELKKKYGIKTKYTILFIGQLINRKGIIELIEGFSDYQKYNYDISLILVGSGLEKNKLEEIILQKNINNVYFPGFLDSIEISELYSIADIFTLPSKEEVWGYVINEAMCFGLPILTTYKVGSSVDLVEEGKNGYIMKQNTKEELINGLEYIFNKGLIEKNNSLEKINSFTIDNTLMNFNI